MKVHGSQPVEPKSIEVNVDTVYVRKNIIRIETDDFVGWEYDEEQYSVREFIGKLKAENEMLELQNKSVSDRSDFLEELIAEMAMLVYQ